VTSSIKVQTVQVFQRKIVRMDVDSHGFPSSFQIFEPSILKTLLDAARVYNGTFARISRFLKLRAACRGLLDTFKRISIQRGRNTPRKKLGILSFLPIGRV
jgi:hypothetical protein